MKPLEELTKDLIKFKTVEGNSQEFEKCLTYIENQFDQQLNFNRFEKEGEKSLLITTGENPRILFHGHIDVVNAEKSMFTPQTKENKIYGRGAADMKSGIACLMKTMEETNSSEIALLITSDEERGGFKGTGHVIEEAQLKPDFVISAEPDDSGIFPSIVTQQKGVLQLQITTEGKSAHSSKPDKGENAAEKIIENYQKIRSLFNHQEKFPTTINLGKLSSEGPVNQIPSKASFQLDIRFSDQYPRNKILEDMKKFDELSIEILKEAPMMKTSKTNPLVVNLRNAAKKSCGKSVIRKEDFASDMRFFTQREIPAVCFGPEGYNLHGENEHVEIESMQKYCEILKNFLDIVEL